MEKSHGFGFLSTKRAFCLGKESKFSGHIPRRRIHHQQLWKVSNAISSEGVSFPSRNLSLGGGSAGTAFKRSRRCASPERMSVGRMRMRGSLPSGFCQQSLRPYAREAYKCIQVLEICLWNVFAEISHIVLRVDLHGPDQKENSHHLSGACDFLALSPASGLAESKGSSAMRNVLVIFGWVG
jgi:hypothetical protein